LNSVVTKNKEDHLEFGIAIDGCLVEYEEDINSTFSRPVCLAGDGPLVDTLV